MRKLFVMLAITAAASMIGSSASAQNYPWCANYGGFFGDGGTNCGFTTYEQCLATISGMGGACERNLQYVPPPGPHDTPVYTRGSEGSARSIERRADLRAVQ